MCVNKFDLLFDREMKVYTVIKTFKQSIKIKTMYPNNIHKISNTKAHLL